MHIISESIETCDGSGEDFVAEVRELEAGLTRYKLFIDDHRMRSTNLLLPRLTILTCQSHILMRLAIKLTRQRRLQDSTKFTVFTRTAIRITLSFFSD